VKRLVDFIGMSVGGWLGWLAGAPISTFAAFITSVVGTALGLWITRRHITRHLP
jgi:uncharacterized membrane protein YeaQ/YmgE (transglycosylase-associated protein family)